MNYFTKLNAWYDNVREPWRILLMLLLVLICTLVFNFVSPAIGILLIVILTISRMAYKGKTNA